MFERYNKLTTYSYDELGRIFDNNLPNNSGTVNSYDVDNRAETVTSSDKDGVFASFRYTYDSLSSVATLSNHKGQQQTRYHYDAFGKVIDSDLSENQYAFTGRQLDPESVLYHFHFRQYDPTSGVWTTADPIGILGGMNLYSYVGNNPVNLRELLGLIISEGELGAGKKRLIW